MNNPTFSVIIPTYNREDLLRKAIHSVLQQSCPDFEVIVIDDASSVDTEGVVNSMNDRRIRYLRNHVNSGPAHSRNQGISLSRGLYISFLDSDDVLMPSFLEESLKEICQTPAEVGFIWVGYRVVDADGLLIKNVIWCPDKSRNQYQSFLEELKIGTGCGLTFKKEVLQEIKLDARLRAAEDTEFLLRVVQKYKFSYVDKILITINKHRDERVTRNYAETLYTYLTILSLHRAAIYSDSRLKTKFFEKIISLSYKINRKKRARKLIMAGAPQTFFSIRILAKFILFEFKSIRS